MLVYNSGYANIHGVNFDLVAGTVGATFNASGTITALPDGWYRVSMTPNANATGSGSLRIRISNVDTSGNINIPTSYTGDGTSGFILWQAQVESGSVATSPIVTTAGTASRVADVVSLTGASSLIGQDSGWVGVSVESGLQAGTTRAICRLTNDSSGTVLDGIVVGKTSTDQVQFILRANNVELARRESSTNISGKIGIVIRYDESGSASIHVNGARAGTLFTTPFTFANPLAVISLGSTQAGANQLQGHLRAYTQGAIAMTEDQANDLSLNLSTI
jgi:hypothetical protein